MRRSIGQQSIARSTKVQHPRSCGLSSLEVCHSRSRTRTLYSECPCFKTLKAFMLSCANFHGTPIHYSSWRSFIFTVKVRPFHHRWIRYQFLSEHSQAADYIERALFTYERAFVGAFTFTNGLNRLDFDRVENRPFFLALHRQVMYAVLLVLICAPFHILVQVICRDVGSTARHLSLRGCSCR